MILTFVILGITTLLFMTGRFRPDLVGLGALLALVLTGILTAQEALVSFSNPVVIMIAGLFVVGGGIFRTGLAAMVAKQLMKVGRDRPIKLLVLVMAVVALLSAFMSNTGTVAVFMPVIIALALSIGASPGAYLIPLAFASSLGGVLTLIGTPPNLIVSQALADNGFAPLAFFDFTPVGLAALFTGMLFMVLVGRKLLPTQVQESSISLPDGRTTLQKVASHYRLSGNLHRVQVPTGSPIVGRTLRGLRLPGEFQVSIVDIVGRTSEPLNILPRTAGEMARPDTVIREQDVLYLQGSPERVQKLAAKYGLIVQENGGNNLPQCDDRLVSRVMGVAEVLLRPHSRFIDRTLVELNFRKKYKLNVLGISRRGDYSLTDVGNQKLQFGDALLVQGEWRHIEALARDNEDVVVLGRPQEEAGMAAARGKAPIAAAIMLGMLVMMTLEIVPVVIAVLVAAFLMVITGCLRNMDDAYSRINWESVILIASMLPMATALEKTGGVLFVSENLVTMLGGYGPLAVLAGFYILTTLFSQFISNTATAVLFAPIAITAAINLGISPYPFMLAVSVAASMAFMTPVASPVNALVMTAGGYKFSDFAKIGVPLSLIVGVVMIVVIPLFFPF
ncbi:MAG: SLC13 family permease [Eubacteriales bacterium]|nr:SLC13 family permease [Desulforudis sp.]MDQ7788419.1 SLC13 family permease [Clostridia bacterium]MDZ4042494.1 SLC13 family permease [Eubacteriales bacterium]MBV1735159.1 SLC13 family permease [Desulforudis sp.]MBV1770668.1 SLC13 family permease [Desulforudis sp.]